MVTCPSFIASSRADCVLGVVRLISSANRTLAKTGPRFEFEFLLDGRVDRDAQNVRGQHVTGELDALKEQSMARRELDRASSCRLRDAFDQQVAFGKDGNQGEADDFVFTRMTRRSDFSSSAARLEAALATCADIVWILLCGLREKWLRESSTELAIRL